MNINAIKSHIKYLKEDRFNKEFYVALLLYDVLDINESDIAEDLIKKADEIIDKFDSIYNEELREEIRYDLKEIEEEIEHEY